MGTESAKNSMVRFVLRLPNQTAELFSVKERNNGNLIIKIKSKGFYTPDHLQPTELQIEDEKISINHNDGRVVNMHFTQSLEGGKSVDLMSLQHANSSELVYPIYAMSCQDLSNPKHRPNSKPTDQEIVVAELPSEMFSVCPVFVYCLVISGVDVNLNQRVKNMHAFHRFQSFDISAFWAIVPFPATPEYSRTYKSTGLPRVNNGPIIKMYANTAPAPVDHAMAEIAAMINMSAMEHVQKLANRYDEPEARNIFDEWFKNPQLMTPRHK